MTDPIKVIATTGDVPMTSRKRTNVAGRVLVVLAAAALMAMTAVSPVEMQAKKPYDKDTLLRVVQLNAIPTSEVVEHIQQRGVEFRMTPGIEAEFRGAGA